MTVVVEAACVMVDGTVMVAVEAALALEQEVAEPKGEDVTVTVDPAGQVEPPALVVTVSVDGVAEMVVVEAALALEQRVWSLFGLV